MDEHIIAIFCLCDDLLTVLHHQESPQCQMNDAEVMTTALVAALFFHGKHESARMMLKQYGYIPQMLSKSRFSRRLHRVKDRFITLLYGVENHVLWAWSEIKGYASRKFVAQSTGSIFGQEWHRFRLRPSVLLSHHS